MLVVFDEAKDVPHGAQKFVLDLSNRLEPIHGQGQSNLDGVEQVLDRTIHRVVRRPEHAPVTRGMNDLLHDDVSVRVEIVHGKNHEVVGCSRSKIMQDHQNKREEFRGRRSSVAPRIDPPPRRASGRGVLPAYCSA